MKRNTLTVAALLFAAITFGQADRWQQAVDYKMNIDFNVEDHTFTGTQTLQYTNNSPDTLSRVFYHLYFNAFQPGSMMDVRSRTIPDPDGRVGDRIAKLTPEEIGYLKVASLTQDGADLSKDVLRPRGMRVVYSHHGREADSFVHDAGHRV